MKSEEKRREEKRCGSKFNSKRESATKEVEYYSITSITNLQCDIVLLSVK
jgi:hypothetical protein